MASWLIHLRVAQGIYEKLNLMEKEAFIIGNIAPDSGVPKADGTGFEPDAQVSHFSTMDEDGIRIVHEEQFIERYFTKEKRVNYSEREYAFYFGYLVHLLTDKLWTSEVIYRAKERLQKKFYEDNGSFWREIKKDFHDLEFLYLKKNPEFTAFRIYERIKEFKNVYLDFFAKDAFEQRRQFIVKYYRDGARRVQERKTDISPEELDTFVEYAVEEIIEEVQRIG